MLSPVLGVLVLAEFESPPMVAPSTLEVLPSTIPERRYIGKLDEHVLLIKLIFSLFLFRRKNLGKSKHKNELKKISKHQKIRKIYKRSGLAQENP